MQGGSDMPDFDEDVRLDTSQVEDRRGLGRRGAVAGLVAAQA